MSLPRSPSAESPRLRRARAPRRTRRRKRRQGALDAARGTGEKETRSLRVVPRTALRGVLAVAQAVCQIRDARRSPGCRPPSSVVPPRSALCFTMRACVHSSCSDASRGTSDRSRTILPTWSSEANRSVTRRGDDLSIDYQREAPWGAVVCFWAASLIASWVLLGLAVAGIWWVVT